VEQLLDEVERALARLDDGTYGSCVTCGGPIGDDRLAEDPTRHACGECAGLVASGAD
jgi:DnaK suppressor protein